MITIKEELVKKLKEGDFSYIDLESWFINHEFTYIFAIIEGCEKTLDSDMLYLISIYAQHLLNEPNAKGWHQETLKELIKSTGWYPDMDNMSHEELIEYWNERIINYCEHILEKVIITGNKNYQYYHPILLELYNHPNDNVRLYCCANLNWEKFLDDNCERVRKVANIRKNFFMKWHSAKLTKEEQQQIEFLTAAIKKNAIHCCDGCVGYLEKDKMTALFKSLLFKKSSWIRNFDKDIFYTISDKRILADQINQLIKEGKIVLRENMAPNYFKEENLQGPTLKRKPNN